MQSSYSIELNVFGSKSDTSHGIYPRAAFMTVFAQNPAAIIRGQLLSRPWLLTGKLRYAHNYCIYATVHTILLF